MSLSIFSLALSKSVPPLLVRINHPLTLNPHVLHVSYILTPFTLSIQLISTLLSLSNRVWRILTLLATPCAGFIHIVRYVRGR